MQRKRILFIFAVIAIFCIVKAPAAKGASSLPIERTQGASFDAGRSIVYILNGDKTISAYNFSQGEFIFSRVSMPGAVNPVQVLISPDGSTLAVLNYNQIEGFRIVLYDAESMAGTPSSSSSYLLGGSSVDGMNLSQGGIRMTFSLDGNSLFASYGKDAFYMLSVYEQKQRKLKVGESPAGIVVDNAGMVLVVNEKSDNLSIIDPISGVLQATVNLGSNPKEILFNKVTDKAYISHVGSDDIYVVDSANSKVIKVIKVGSDPTALAYDEENGAVFAANNTAGTLSVISKDFSVKTVELNSAAYFESTPIRLAYLNGEKKLFILNASEERYLVYDTVQARLVGEGKTDFFPFRIFSSEKEKAVFVLHWNGNSLFAIDSKKLTASRIPESFSATGMFFSKPQSVAVDDEANRIYISNVGGDYVTVIDGATQKPLKKIMVGRSIQNVLLNKSSKKLYAVSPSDNTFTVIDIVKNDYPTKTVQLEQQPRGGSINEKTNRIYYSNSAVAKLTAVDGARDEVIATIDFPPKSFPLISSIDEKRNRIYTALYGGDAIAVVNGENNKIEKIIPTGRNPIWVRYIPKLDKVLVSVEREGKVLVIDPTKNEISQTILVSGRPYRIFFDSQMDFVYINRRGEDLVTVFKSNGVGLDQVTERMMPYWGQTDARPYNMIDDNEKTQLAYLTAGIAEKISVIKISRDSDGILNGNWYATVSANGDVVYATAANTGGFPKEEIPRWYVWIAGVFVLCIGIGSVFIARRRAMGLKNPPGTA